MLLHDGGKIIVTRSQTYGGRHELGESPPIREHTITFSLPNSDKKISWTSEYSKDVGFANFNLLALHILNETPYLVANPVGCLSYNKWGRPNPPYVIFKYDGKEWQRIPLTEFPAEFKTINLVADAYRQYDIREAQKGFGYVPARSVLKINSSLPQPEYKNILREPMAHAGGDCAEMIRTRTGWEGLGFFELNKSYEACVDYCNKKGVKPSDCPCYKLFKGAN